MEKLTSCRTLIFFTSAFPYGTGETFIESEFPYLAKNFERVIIVTNTETAGSKRAIPSNVEVIHLPYPSKTISKIRAVGQLLSADLQFEFKFIQNRGLVEKLPALKSAVVAYAKALEVSDFLKTLVQKNNLPLESLYLYSYWMNDMALGIALFKKKHSQVKTFCRAHGWDVYFERHQPPYLPLRNFILSNINACFCISQSGQHYIQQLTADETSKSKVRLSRLGTINSNTLQLSAPSVFRLVSCSGIISLKRLHLIVEALAIIDDLDVEWIHFGSGPLEVSIKQQAKERLAAKTNVKFEFKGQADNAGVLRFYNENPVSAFINVSETEGLPVSIMEAMSFGIPAIATRVGGVSEIVEHEKNGFLLSANPSTGEIASAIKQMASLSQMQKTSLNQGAYNTWKEKFNADNNYSSFLKEILSL